MKKNWKLVIKFINTTIWWQLFTDHKKERRNERKIVMWKSFFFCVTKIHFLVCSLAILWEPQAYLMYTYIYSVCPISRAYCAYIIFAYTHVTYFGLTHRVCTYNRNAHSRRRAHLLALAHDLACACRHMENNIFLRIHSFSEKLTNGKLRVKFGICAFTYKIGVMNTWN